MSVTDGHPLGRVKSQISLTCDGPSSKFSLSRGLEEEIEYDNVLLSLLPVAKGMKDQNVTAANMAATLAGKDLVEQGGIYWYHDCAEGVDKQVKVVRIDRTATPPSVVIDIDGRERTTVAASLSLHPT